MRARKRRRSSTASATSHTHNVTHTGKRNTFCMKESYSSPGRLKSATKPEIPATIHEGKGTGATWPAAAKS